MNKKVSVLIGTYNREDLLSRNFDSIFTQSYKNIEIIVVDDFSSDNTVQVLQKYAKNYPEQFKYIVNEKNRGISYNCNRAYEVASGDYFALVGDDDYWIDKEKIQKQIDILENDKSIGIVGTWWQEDDTQSIVYKKPLEPNNWEERMLSGGGVICGSTPLIKKEAWDKAGGFDEKQKRGTDSDLFRRIILSGFKGRILYENTTSVDTNFNRNRMTSSSDKIKTYQDHIDSMEYNLEKLKSYYDKYPSAKAIYFERLSWLYNEKSKINMDSNKIAIKYLKNSLLLSFTIKKLLKYLKIKILG